MYCFARICPDKNASHLQSDISKAFMTKILIVR